MSEDRSTNPSPNDPRNPVVKCLLVDDVADNLAVLSAVLQREGVELLLARSGIEALELLLNHEVALALLDIQMPDMDGFELAELMRGSERSRHVPIIFITAGTHDQRRLFRGYEIGAVDFIFKPIEPHILASKAEVFFKLHRQQQQLVRELRERTESLRLNELFMAVLGHDLRGPLSAILNWATLLQQRPDEPTAREGAARILSSGRAMNRLISDVLDFARAKLGGGIPVRLEPVRLDALIADIVPEHRTAHPGRTIEVSGEGDLVGFWDADRLRQVVSNLLGNALEHGERGPILVQLDGTLESTVTLCVTNPGTIRPESLPHLFDPFRGGQREAAPSQGLGLGLYIVGQIVSAHGGRVEVNPGVAERTVFRVILPRGPNRVAVGPSTQDT